MKYIIREYLSVRVHSLYDINFNSSICYEQILNSLELCLQFLTELLDRSVMQVGTYKNS